MLVTSFSGNTKDIHWLLFASVYGKHDMHRGIFFVLFSKEEWWNESVMEHIVKTHKYRKFKTSILLFWKECKEWPDTCCSSKEIKNCVVWLNTIFTSLEMAYDIKRGVFKK